MSYDDMLNRQIRTLTLKNKD